MVRPGFTTTVDVKSGKVSQLASAGGDHIALPIPGPQLLLVTQRRGVVRLVDKAHDKVVAEILAGKNPNSAVYDATTKMAYAMNKNGGDITIIDPVQRKAAGTITVGGTLEFVVSDGRGMLFDNVKSANQIVVIDAAQRRVVARFPLKDCQQPTGLAYVADGKLLISACSNGMAKVLHADTGAEIASLAIGHGPDAVIYDPVRKLAFIPCGDDGALDIVSISTNANKVVQRLPTQEGTRTGTIDPETGRVYLMASKPSPAMAGKSDEEDGARLKGSFEILVVGQGG